jgi:hypothetical protein
MAISRSPRKLNGIDAPGGSHQVNGPAAVDPLVLDPNELRERLRAALAEMSFDQYSVARLEFIRALRRDGIDVGTTLLVLGSTARTSDEVLPSDLAHLIRYARINRGERLKAVNRVLTRVLNPAARFDGRKLAA